MSPRFSTLVALSALAACTTVPASGPSAGKPPAAAAPTRATSMPTAPIDLGDPAKGSVDATIARFSGQIMRRYPDKAPLAGVEADLRRNAFACGPSNARRGDPPDRVCRRVVRAAGCAHTFQVHLFVDGKAAKLDRVRALYDRQCGGDGLLGGPGA